MSKKNSGELQETEIKQQHLKFYAQEEKLNVNYNDLDVPESLERDLGDAISDSGDLTSSASSVMAASVSDHSTASAASLSSPVKAVSEKKISEKKIFSEKKLSEKPPQPFSPLEESESSVYKIKKDKILAENLVNNAKTYNMTPDEKKRKALEYYYKLQQLVKSDKIELTRKFYLDSPFEELEAEYNYQYSLKDRRNHVKLYKDAMVMIANGIEFFNKSYDPFGVDLDGWSMQLSSDKDSYTEVFEQLYEKYKSKGGDLPPEIKLIGMILMSAFTFHMSKALFTNDFDKNIGNNPSILNTLLGNFGGSFDKTATQTATQGNVPHNSERRRVLEVLRNSKKNKTLSEESEKQKSATATQMSATAREHIIRQQNEIKLMQQQQQQTMMQQKLYQQKIAEQQEELNKIKQQTVVQPTEELQKKILVVQQKPPLIKPAVVQDKIVSDSIDKLDEELEGLQESVTSESDKTSVKKSSRDVSEVSTTSMTTSASKKKKKANVLNLWS